MKLLPITLKSLLLLPFQLITPLEPLHLPSSIHHPAFPGEERVTVAAYLDLKHLPRGAGNKGIAASTDDLGIGVILGMNLILHSPKQRKRWPSSYSYQPARI